MNHTESVFHFLKKLKNEINQILNSFFIFGASEKNEMHYTKFVFHFLKTLKK